MIHCARFAPLALALLPQAGSPADSLRFAPEQGSTLTRTFEIERQMEGGDLEVVMDGFEVPPEFLPVLDLEIESSQRVVLIDHYRKVESGRVTEFTRTYDEVELLVDESQAMSATDQSPESSSESEARADAKLSGRTVRFLWDSDEEEYERSYEGDRADDDERALLSGLAATADLSGFLPEGEVSNGESWDVDAAVLATLLHPGGDLGLIWEGDLAEEYSAFPEEVTFEGTLRCKFTGRHERDGVSLATITVEGEFTMVEVMATNLERVPGIDGDATETTTSQYEIEGELQWNLDAGHLAELELEASVEVESKLVRDPGQPGPEFETTVYLAGTETWTVRVEASE